MPTRTLPDRPNLDQLKRQARELQRDHEDRNVSAAARIIAHHPEMKALSLQAALEAPFALADAQLVIAREYGFPNWAALKRQVEFAGEVASVTPHPRFAEALDALDSGDVERLRALLHDDPTLLRARSELQPPYGYFTGATLLHYVAGNPGRDRPLPDNIVEIARVLLDAGADPNARTLAPGGPDGTGRGSTTMGLLVTSAQASNRGFSGPLIDLLLERGARLDVHSDNVLDHVLANHAPRAAEKMIELGARPDLFAAAALGRMDWLRAMFDDEGRLRERPRRHGVEMDPRDAIGLAMLYAYVRKQSEAVEFLLTKDGNWNMTGVNNGTAMHRAAWSGDLEMVKRLVALGADPNNRDNPFHGTPMDWAWHNKQPHVIEWLQRNVAIDLHNAVTWGLRDHVDARLREDPEAVNRRRDDGDTPNPTPLHIAAYWNHAEIATLLLDRGAQRDALDATGKTPLDVAESRSAAETVAVLNQRMARRASDAPTKSKILRRPLYSIDERDNSMELRPLVEERDWDEVMAILEGRRIAKLQANGQVTDAVMPRLAKLPHLTQLGLSGSKRLTDDGLRHLADMPQLEHIDLCWVMGVSDAGLSALAHCDRLQSVDLLGSLAGDATLAALRGKPQLRRLKTGRNVTDAGLPLLREFPVFTTWHGGECVVELMSYEGAPNHLLVDGPFTNAGFAHLRGLDGLFGLSFFWHTKQIRSDGFGVLRTLANLGYVGAEDDLSDDTGMRHFAEMPKLKLLMAQGSTATDAGFEALSRSRTLEYLWGRDAPNFRSGGFEALGTIPTLRGLGITLKAVDDGALARLPQFPALRELMPMDLTDEGFRHVGQCVNLERLWCMYCRNTGDAATAQIEALTKLRTYYAGQTMITDRSLDILSRMPSLEKLEFWNCSGITNAGVVKLAALPRLRELSVDDCRNVTGDAASAFAASVRVKIG